MRVCEKDCQRRSSTCHSTCEKYIEFRERRDKALQKKEQEWLVDDALYHIKHTGRKRKDREGDQ